MHAMHKNKKKHLKSWSTNKNFWRREVYWRFYLVIREHFCSGEKRRYLTNRKEIFWHDSARNSDQDSKVTTTAKNPLRQKRRGFVRIVTSIFLPLGFHILFFFWRQLQSYFFPIQNKRRKVKLKLIIYKYYLNWCQGLIIVNVITTK